MNDPQSNQQNQPYAPQPQMPPTPTFEPSDDTTSAAPEASITPRQLAPQKSHIPKIMVVASVVLALFAIAGATLAYWQYSAAVKARNDNTATQHSLTAAQATIASLNKKAATPVESTDTPTKPATNAPAASGSGTVSPAASSDQVLITSVITAYDRAKATPAGDALKVNVAKIQLPFARAEVSNATKPAGGETCVLKKADTTTWVLLYCGNGESSYSAMQNSTYNVPASILQ